MPRGASSPLVVTGVLAGMVEHPVLVLNANYEPLNICSTRRAVGLMMTGKAEVLLHRSSLIHSPSHSFPQPSIVRLAHMVSRPRPRVKLTKREVFRRDAFTCQYCGKQGAPLTIDHVTPRNRRGGHSWENLVTACPACNRRKGDRTPEEAGMPLRTRPREPSASAEYLFGRVAGVSDEWYPFIEGW